MINIALKSDKPDNAVEILNDIVETEISRLTYGFGLAKKRLKKFEKKYSISYEKFISEYCAEDLDGKDANRLIRLQIPKPEYFVHETFLTDEKVFIDKGTKIWHFSHILSGTRNRDVTAGNNCKIQNNVSIYKGVTLEDGVFCGPSMVFTNVYNPRAEIRKTDQIRPTSVKKGASIGANAAVICGNTVGRYAFIGAALR